ncbi:MAG: hypothetical protein JSS61_04095 [Verrucomicrobia bacterium]|nr:hypothetical protein [Verrucomicrobiota bacterium]
MLGLQQWIELKTRGFCLQKILCDDLPQDSRWEVPPLSFDEMAEVEELLKEPYHLMGSGSECFAFESASGKAVIKFFKLDTLRPVYIHRGIFREDHSAEAGTFSKHPWLSIEWPWMRRLIGMRDFRLTRTFQSIHLAYTALKEETGLLYLHLNPTTHLQTTLHLTDSCGNPFSIDLDTARFFLQKKAVPLESHLARCQPEEAKACIDALIEQILSRCQKGFYDRDLCNRNFGFVGNRAIEIDSGSYSLRESMQEPLHYKREVYFATRELAAYLKINYPEIEPYLEEKVASLLCLRLSELPPKS